MVVAEDVAVAVVVVEEEAAEAVVAATTTKRTSTTKMLVNKTVNLRSRKKSIFHQTQKTLNCSIAEYPAE